MNPTSSAGARSPSRRAESLAWRAALPTLALVVAIVMTYFPSSDSRATAREQQTTKFMKALDARDRTAVGAALCDPQIPPSSFLAQLLAGGLPAGGYHFYGEAIDRYRHVIDETFELDQPSPSLKGVGIRLASTSNGGWCVQTALPNPPGQYL